MRRTLRSTACLPLLTALALAGCTQDPGNVEIPFSIGASSVTCETANVATVEMTLTEISDEGGEDPLEYQGSAPCTDGSVTCTGIAATNYEVTAVGVSSDGLTTWDNQDPSSLKKVEALAGQDVTTEEVRMTPTPARILVRWELTKGGAQGQCSGVETKKFQISAFDEDGFNALLSADAVDCDAEQAESPYHVIPDPDRDVAGDRLGQIDIAPQDADGNPVGSPSTVILDQPPGFGVSVRVVVSCVDDECTAELAT